VEKTTRQDSRMAIRKNCGQNYIFVVLHFNLFGLAKQATSRTHLIDFLPSINEEDSYRFSDSRSLMSKLPRRVSARSPKGVLRAWTQPYTPSGLTSLHRLHFGTARP